jgi:hypothetical protein
VTRFERISFLRLSSLKRRSAQSDTYAASGAKATTIRAQQAQQSVNGSRSSAMRCKNTVYTLNRPLFEGIKTLLFSMQLLPSNSIIQIQFHQENQRLQRKVKSTFIFIRRLTKIDKPILCNEIIITVVSESYRDTYLTLKRKYSLSFLKVGSKAILSHFSFNNPGPFKGPPLLNPNLFNCVLSLKSMKG